VEPKLIKNMRKEKVIIYLVKHEADINIIKNKDETVIDWASEKGKYGIVKIYLDNLQVKRTKIK